MYSYLESERRGYSPLGVYKNERVLEVGFSLAFVQHIQDERDHTD